jgi:hypothetical protein
MRRCAISMSRAPIPWAAPGNRPAARSTLIKVATEAAMGKRDGIEVFGSDYPTRDGTCVRDFIHVADLVAAHLDALTYLRAGGDSLVANCGYGRGYTVREVLDSVRRLSGRDFEVRLGPRAGPAISSLRLPIPPGPALSWAGPRATTTSTRSSAVHSPGKRRLRVATTQLTSRRGNLPGVLCWIGHRPTTTWRRLSATRWPSPPCWPAAGTGDSHLDRSGRRQPATGFRLSNTGGRFSPLAT